MLCLPGRLRPGAGGKITFGMSVTDAVNFTGNYLRRSI